MFEVRRLLAVGAALALGAACTSAPVWGGPKEDNGWHKSTPAKPAPADRQFADELDASRFADAPLARYHESGGKDAFALQVRAGLPKDLRDERPRDVAVVVVTSASQAQGPLEISKAVAEALPRALRDGDRVALWTASNTPRDLSHGFKPASALAGALDDLKQEYPAGATNLKDALTKVVAAFDDQPGRQRRLLLLGDGKSLAGPIDAAERAALADEMVKREVAFFAVPLGARLDPINLHGFASATGGKVVRADAADALEVAQWLRKPAGTPKLLTRLRADLDAPVLYPHTFKLPAGVAESFPTRLPPLRADAPTLVVGTFAPAERFAYTLGGTAAGVDVPAKAVELAVPAADDENFFLVNLVSQWRGDKTRPALIRADRALAYAHERNQMARADLLAKADMAMDQDQFGAASKLYKQALTVDPHNAEARSGAKIAEELQLEMARHEKDKNFTVADARKVLRDRFRSDDRRATMTRILPGAVIQVAANDVFAAQEDPKAPGAPPARPAEPLPDPIRDVQARQAIADQQAGRATEEAVREANRRVLLDPNNAREYLKRVLDDLRNNPDVSDRAKAALNSRLERSLDTVDRVGSRVLRDQAEASRLAEVARARLDVTRLEQATQDRIRARLQVFHDLMNQAREQDAYRQAQAIRQDLISQGQPVPPAVTAAYVVGINGYNLREVQELRRVREERFLATLMQVERSAVPFPDEPPVEFPPAAAWRALTDRRKSRYETDTLGAQLPRRTLELRDALSKPVRYQGIDDPKITLGEALEQLSQVYKVQFDVNEKAFRFEMVNDVTSLPIAAKPIPPTTASLGSVLRRILSRVEVGTGATYIIRPDTIEITTNQFAGAEKAIRAYPVADLVFPIPNAVDQRSVQQQATLFGFAGAVGTAVTLGGALGAAGGLGALGLGGGLGALGALGAGGLGALGALGALGGGLGALGALGGGLGALGALGGGLGALGGGLGALGAGGLGALGGGAQGVPGGVGGFAGNFQGNANLGVGGGAAGFGGGQLGQFGNLGGQFGLQGGTQDRILITLIQQTVGRVGDWRPQFDPLTGRKLRVPGQDLDDEQDDKALLGGDNNNLGYYPPARALVVKGTSRIQLREAGPVSVKEGGMVAGPHNDRGDAMVRIGGPKAPAAGAGGAAQGGAAQGGDRVAAADRNPPDPKKVWQEALAKGATQPGMIIACADYLALGGKFDHAAEFLKADLRQGVVVEPWVYQSLALALRNSGGSAEDVERAETSALELEPGDGRAYLKAAKALADDQRYDRAVAFCRQAAQAGPNVPAPYAEALAYAEKARDPKAMEWAAGSLLQQDWPSQNQELQAKAVQRSDALARLLDSSGRGEEARRLRETVRARGERDLVVKLSWQDRADLDLKVTEPTGSVCWALNRQTVGGGTLVGDTLTAGGDGAQSETYLATQAFPGRYRVAVQKVSGKPLGDRAQLRIIRHQGTPQETEELRTVELASGQPVVFDLDDGRRTEAAFVPPPAALDPEPQGTTVAQASARAQEELRALADPDITSVQRGFAGSAGSPGAVAVSRPSAPKAGAAPDPGDRTYYATKVSSFVRNSVDVVAQAQVSSDRRYVRLSVAPVFAGNAGPAGPVAVADPLIPGAARP